MIKPPESKSPRRIATVVIDIMEWGADKLHVVRRAMPRISGWSVDIIEGGTIAGVCPQAIDVGSLQDQYD